MSITSELNTWWGVKVEQYDDPNSVKALLQTMYTGMNDSINDLKAASDAGKFDDFPGPDSKAKAIAMYNAVRTVRNSIRDDAESQELLGWTP